MNEPFDQDTAPLDPIQPIEDLTPEEGKRFIQALNEDDQETLLIRYRAWFEFAIVMIISWFVFLGVVTLSVVWIRWLIHFGRS